MTNHNNNNELEELRQQFALLQTRLDQQVEIKDKQMKKALRAGIGQMRGRDHMAIVICLVGWIFTAAALYCIDVSVPFQIFTDVCMGINFVCSVLMKLHVNDFKMDGMASSDLIRTSQELMRYKRNNQRYMRYVSIPFIIVFFCWFCYEQIIVMNVFTPKEVVLLCIPLLLGGLLGGTIGVLYFYRPSMRQADEMLKQIQELQEA